MLIRIGFELVYGCTQPTPMILTLNVHYSRVSDLVQPDHLLIEPAVPISGYRDSFGNWCSRVVVGPGRTRITTNALVRDSGTPDVIAPHAQQRSIQSLPEETLLFLLGSRYCETDLLSEAAWKLFAHVPAGWARVQAVCDFVHQHLTFGYQHANPTRTAFQAWHERVGVCRDYAHLAIALCRCLNVPARYCTGYLGDIGVPASSEPMDFSGWFEAYLGDAWYTFDPRNHMPRIGRILIARGRDAADVAISTNFGATTLESFRVWTDEVSA